MTTDNCLYTCNHHPKQATSKFHEPQEVLSGLFLNSFPPLSTNNYFLISNRTSIISDFFHFKVVITHIVKYSFMSIFFCLINGFEIHLCC